ncbi:MAG: MmgE/PrpD family protein [Clostridiales bacterium]|nr:MmgE/PrpD family protein [Clostridiales bacterium]
MSDNLTEKFNAAIYDISKASLPADVKEKVRECFLDYLSIVIGGCKTNYDVNKKFIEENHLTGDIHAVGMNVSTDIRTAICINAFNAHILELDDSHRVAMTHLGAPIFSALLGVGELYCCTFDQLLCAAVVGYEAAIRLANAIQPGHKKRGFHVSGTCCTVGCAMGIAAMLDYSQDEMLNVLSAAATSAAGLLAVISGKSEQKPYNIANAAVAGTNAALYGKYFVGAVDILNDARGFFHAMSDHVNPDKLFEEGYAIRGIYQKLYAACRHCHAPMEAMLRIRNEDRFSADDIVDIEVRVYDLAVLGHDHTVINGVSSAKQSIPYGVAVACMYGQCGIEAFTEERTKDEALLSLVKKVRVVESAELSALVPQKRAAIVSVTLTDGKHYSQRVDYPKGEPENPITKEELLNKFASLAGSAGMNDDRRNQVLDYVVDEKNKPIIQLVQLLQDF